MKTITLTFFFALYMCIYLRGDENNLIQNENLLAAKIKSAKNNLTPKEILLQLKQPKLAVLIDLKAGQKDDYSKPISLPNEEMPLYQYLDLVLKDTDLFYHIEKDSLIIGSEWLWLTKEDVYQNEYDISDLYNEKEEFKTLIASLLRPFDIVKCHYEINLIGSNKCTIRGNKYIHYYLRQFFLNLRKPIFDYSETSPTLIFTAESYFKNKGLNANHATLSGEEWLILIGQLNQVPIQFNNEKINKDLKSNLIKIEKENETINSLIEKIKLQIKENIYYQKSRGVFFQENLMIKRTPIQKIKFRIYNIKQFSDKVNGTYICQNIKDEIKKEVWVFPENQIIYYKHLEAIIVICPTEYFYQIDNFFYNLKNKK